MSDEEGFFVVSQAPMCIVYIDEYEVTLISLGPSPNKVRQYLRERFTYTLAEVMAVKLPLVLFASPEPKDADLIKVEMEELGAGIRIVLQTRPREEPPYPQLRVPLPSRI